MWPLLMILGCGPDPLPPFARSDPYPAGDPPNVLVVVLDDVSPDRIGVYAEHPDPPRTPVLDDLARRGVRFTNAWSYPVCSPARAALMTGRHGRRTGIAFNIRMRSHRSLTDSETLLPAMLAQAEGGWTSAGVGKWHLESKTDQDIAHPHDAGFGYYAGVLGNLTADEAYDDYTWVRDDGTVLEHETPYLTTREVDEAIRLVDTLPAPWFVFLSLHAPHFPWTPPPPDLVVEPVDADDPPDRRFAAVLEAADTELGRLFARLDPARTLVMVIGDNGSPEDAVVAPFAANRAKNTMYEGGINVPWIVAGPDIAPGAVREDLVHVVDLFPTLAATAGIVPDRPGVPIDGRDLWPALHDLERAPRRTLFTEKYVEKSRRNLDVTFQALRGSRYKVIRSSKEFEGSRPLPTASHGMAWAGFFDLAGRHDDGPNLLARDRPLTAGERAALDDLLTELDRTHRALAPPRKPSSPGCRRTLRRLVP